MINLAVITGDLVGSTVAQHSGAYHRQLDTLLKDIAARYKARFQTYRGDGFQVVIAPGNALEACLLLRAGLIAASPHKQERWDARLAIAFGSENAPAAEFNGEFSGASFILSGRTLDAMETETLRMVAQSLVLQTTLDLAAAFLDNIVSHWTVAEAASIFEYLKGRENHQIIADRLGKQRPTVTLALKRAHYNLIDRCINDTRLLLELIGD